MSDHAAPELWVVRRLDRVVTSTVSVLGFERETPVLLKWNS